MAKRPSSLPEADCHEILSLLICALPASIRMTCDVSVLISLNSSDDGVSSTNAQVYSNKLSAVSSTGFSSLLRLPLQSVFVDNPSLLIAQAASFTPDSAA